MPIRMVGFLSGRVRPAACRVRLAASARRSRAVEQRASERRVRKRRWGESGSNLRSKPLPGIDSAVAAAVGRRGERERAARAQHAARLRQEQLDVAHVLERLRAEHEVELAVGERQRRVGRRAPHAPPPGSRAGRALERDARRRRPASARAPAAPRSAGRRRSRGRARSPPGPASATKRTSSGGRRPVLLGHELPELVVVAAGYQAPFARMTAGTVFSMIERSRNTDQCSR